MTVIISPIFKEFFAGRIWMGVDYDVIKSELETKYNIKVKIIAFQDLKEFLNTIPHKAVLFYSSAYNLEYLKFIQDTVRYIALKRPDIILLPDEHQLNSLENKGYQELYKDLLGIEQVDGVYFGDIEQLIEVESSLSYPFVLKKNKGALSSGVQLIKSKAELFSFRDQVKKKTLKEKLAFIVNRRNSFRKDSNLLPKEELLNNNFSDFFAKRMPVVVQKFVPGLNCDFKILIFGEKYYCLQRKTRVNDFRASGSGNFSFIDPPFEILNYAKTLNSKFKVPFISLDLGIDEENKCYLFEFQGTAFGPMTLTQSTYYFLFQNNEWIKIDETPNLEREYANAIVQFIHKK